MDDYWSVIQQKICRKCIDGDGRGRCRLPADEQCAIREFLPQIVQIAGSVKSNSMDAYVVALRAQVCAQCIDQGPDGVCRRRNQLECALDRYYPLVLEVIEDARARSVAIGA